jgi:hypothetical protein
VATATAIKGNKLLSLNTDVRVLMIPSDAKGVIVNRSSTTGPIKISCTIPAKKRKVHSSRSNKPINIVSPPTIFRLDLADIPLSNIRELICNYFVHGYYSNDKKRLWTAPYRLPNVYPDGAVCFGSVYPADLRAVHNLFWETPFNHELEDCSADLIDSLGKYDEIDSYDLEHYIKIYKKKLFDSQDWVDNTDFFLGKKPWLFSNPAHGILLSSNKQLLEQIPKEHRVTYKKRPFVVANARRHKNVWSFDTGNFKFKLPIERVLTKESR